MTWDQRAASSLLYLLHSNFINQDTEGKQAFRATWYFQRKVSALYAGLDTGAEEAPPFVVLGPPILAVFSAGQLGVPVEGWCATSPGTGP